MSLNTIVFFTKRSFKKAFHFRISNEEVPLNDKFMFGAASRQTRSPDLTSRPRERHPFEEHVTALDNGYDTDSGESLR